MLFCFRFKNPCVPSISHSFMVETLILLHTGGIGKRFLRFCTMEALVYDNKGSCDLCLTNWFLDCCFELLFSEVFAVRLTYANMKTAMLYLFKLTLLCACWSRMLGNSDFTLLSNKLSKWDCYLDAKCYLGT